MFDWFWNFLYSISEILFEVVDGCLDIANKLCGVSPIYVKGEKTSFMLEMFRDPRIMYGFGGAALIGIFLLMIFGVIAICRNCKTNKKSSSHIAVDVFKILGMFFMVPALMFAFTILLNLLVQQLYIATMGGKQSLGSFLFESFLPSGMENYSGGVDWHSTKSVRVYMAGAGFDLSDYRFFFSWLVCIPLLFCIAKSLLMFVDRTLSILILFIMSPISMSTAVLDDGARFKLWRDKVIAKYISGYGMILAVNIYIIVLSFITDGSVSFFGPDDGAVGSICNFLLKVAFAIGGAYFLPKVFGLVGDLFVNGAGDREFQNAESAYNTMKQAYREMKADARQRKGDKDRQNDKKKQQEDKVNRAMSSKGGGSSGNGNNKKMSMGKAGPAAAVASIIGNTAKNVGETAANIGKSAVNINENGGGGNNQEGGSGNQNSKTNDVPGGATVKNAIADVLNGNKGK